MVIYRTSTPSFDRFREVNIMPFYDDTTSPILACFSASLGKRRLFHEAFMRFLPSPSPHTIIIPSVLMQSIRGCQVVMVTSEILELVN